MVEHSSYIYLLTLHAPGSFQTNGFPSDVTSSRGSRRISTEYFVIEFPSTGASPSRIISSLNSWSRMNRTDRTPNVSLRAHLLCAPHKRSHSVSVINSSHKVRCGLHHAVRAPLLSTADCICNSLKFIASACLLS